MKIREVVASRLNQEIIRKGFTSDMLVHETHLTKDVIQAYLDGNRELQFSELGPICDALVLQPMRLLSADFAVSKLQYRSAGQRDKKTAGQIENAFLTSLDFLPAPRKLATSIDDKYNDPPMLVVQIQHSLVDLTKKYPTVETLYRAAALPILPVNAGDDAFDAFLMRSGKKVVVCVNLNKPNVRIHFSLLHEMAHYLFHGNVDVPIDFLPRELYDNHITDDAKPEYIANKFAQFFLVPFADAEKFATRLNSLDGLDEYLSAHRTSPQVLANAIYDILKIRNSTCRYDQITSTITAATISYGDKDNSLRNFLNEEGQKLRRHLSDQRNEFSDDVWKFIKTVWEIKDE
jgi:Zn-dependent peptidase ImmA (M78 family)